ncbi:hypothetical protein Aperf_G00000093316 [Anoplocephala perfoliata]
MLDNSMSLHLLGEPMENVDTAYYGISCSTRTLPEVVKLIDSIRRDEAGEFECFNFDQIQDLKFNVILSHLPCKEYMASSFWKILHNVNLIQLASILSSHSVMDIILKQKIKRIQSDEGVSAIHICAAMGDYIGLRKLIKANLSTALQDKLGRTALHYATQTNLPVVIMLLANDPTLFHIQDSFGKLPVDYCQSNSPQSIHDFLVEYSKVPSIGTAMETDETDIEFEPMEQEAQENNMLMALNFEAYLCTQLDPLYCYEGHTYCRCGDDAYNHETFSGNATLDKLIASRKERFIKRPTNAFGQFESLCSKVVAEFVRLTNDTGKEDLEKLFFGIWKLRKPGLVLTLHGSAPISKDFQKRCYDLIFGVFHKALAWIITDGQCGSVSEVMSMGMTGCMEAYGLKRLQVIGIVPWRRLPFQANLRSSNYMGSTHVGFPQKGPKSELHTPLASYHTRYLFVDSGPKNDIYCIQEFRTMFEVWLSKLTYQLTNCKFTHKTSVCGVLIAGRPEDALGVCEALKNNIPFVVAADSGGLASIIEQYLSETTYDHEMGQNYAEQFCSTMEADQERLLDIMMRYWPEESITNEFLGLVTTIISYSHLMQFFFVETDRSLNGKIVSVLMNPALFEGLSKRQSWIPRLKLAMELNQTDAALERILAESHWTLQEISPFARSCLLTNNLQFLRLFCSTGLNMYELADLNLIEDLFTVEAHSNTVGGRMLKQIFVHYNPKLPPTITIEIVDQALKKLMRRNYLTSDKDCGGQSKVFEDIALSILNQCYGSSVESTMQLLIMERRTFGQVSCFVMAAEGNCKHFMEHQACRDYLDRVWNHTLLEGIPSCKFAFSLFVGIICPPAIPFIADYDESKYVQEISNAKEDIYNDPRIIKKDPVKVYRDKLIDFYTAPCVRHAYQVSLTHCRSWSNYAGKWENQFTLVALAFYVIGVMLQVFSAEPSHRTLISEQFSRICLAFAATLPFLKLLQLLSIRCYFGPKLQMIKKMVVRDLLPFLIIVLMFWTMYTILFNAIILRPSSFSDIYGAISRHFRIMRTGFFHMFGEFNIEALISYYENNSCGNLTTPGCTYPYSKFMLPFLQSVFTLTTNVLLINLLIAIFTKTYDNMEAESQQLWTMQRYVLMGRILSQPVLTPAFSIFTLIYQCCKNGFRHLNPHFKPAICNKDRPFQKSFQNSPARARQLVNWEKLNALIVARVQETGEESSLKSRKEEGPQWEQKAGARSNHRKRRQITRQFLPNDHNKDGMKESPLEKKIEQIDSALENMMSYIKNSRQRTPSRSPTRLVTNGQSLRSGDENLDPPISFQWQNHHLAFYATLNSDITPHTLDPPVPWEVPFLDYAPLRWRPSGLLIPSWEVTVNGTSKKLEPPVHSVNSSPLSTLLKPVARNDSSESLLLRNPEGRVGTAGKGLLPEFGGNQACIIIVEKELEGGESEVLVLKGARVQVQFPWFLCRHEIDCSQTACFKELVSNFCMQILVASGKKHGTNVSQTMRQFIAGYNRHLRMGPVSDPINCDNAWLEATAILFKINYDFPSIEELEQIFTIKGGKAKWTRTDSLPPMRSSHLAAFKATHQE